MEEEHLFRHFYNFSQVNDLARVSSQSTFPIKLDSVQVTEICSPVTAGGMSRAGKDRNVSPFAGAHQSWQVRERRQCPPHWDRLSLPIPLTFQITLGTHKKGPHQTIFL